MAEGKRSVFMSLWLETTQIPYGRGRNTDMNGVSSKGTALILFPSMSVEGLFFSLQVFLVECNSIKSFHINEIILRLLVWVPLSWLVLGKDWDDAYPSGVPIWDGRDFCSMERTNSIGEQSEKSVQLLLCLELELSQPAVKVNHCFIRSITTQFFLFLYILSIVSKFPRIKPIIYCCFISISFKDLFYFSFPSVVFYLLCCTGQQRYRRPESQWH